MAISTKIDKEFVLKVFGWYRLAMLSVGRGASLPKNTDPTKTYTYRAIKSFAQKMIDWEFDDSTIQIFIRIIVRYAKSKKLLAKGSYLLTMGSILDICHLELQRRSDTTDALTVELQKNHEFVKSLGEDNKVILSRLICPVSHNGCSGIVYHYSIGDIDLSYLALSKICNRALNKIPSEDRSELPKTLDILKVRIRILNDNDNIDVAKSILKDDLTTRGIRSGSI
ncbi:MAG: hypothetical protein ACTSPI_17330 [Candidatus Heimdallarchaeaceae archaeon]